MSEAESDSTPAFPGVPAALLLALGLLLGLGCVGFVAWNDRRPGAHTERFEQTTAVGDNVYVEKAQQPAPGTVLATLNGQPLAAVSSEKLKARDTQMQRAGQDPASRLTIYISREALPAPEGTPAGETFYYVKTASNEYLRLHAAR